MGYKAHFLNFSDFLRSCIIKIDWSNRFLHLLAFLLEESWVDVGGDSALINDGVGHALVKLRIVGDSKSEMPVGDFLLVLLLCDTSSTFKDLFSNVLNDASHHDSCFLLDPLIESVFSHQIHYFLNRKG